MENHREYCLIHNDASLDVDGLLDIVGKVIEEKSDMPLTHASVMAVSCLLIANSLSQEMEFESAMSLESAASLLQDALPYLVETILCACHAFIRTHRE